MAEVPEVQTIVDDLNASVVGRKLLGAQVLMPEAIRFPAPELFAVALAGYTIQRAERHGKHILLPLDGGMTLAVHFMLWGTLRLLPTGSECPPHTQVRIFLDGDEELQLRDTLGYARAAFGSDAEIVSGLGLDTLGPDALAPDFTVELLQQRLARRRGALKTVLINPKVLTGLGNRDADESMWLAGIDPQRAPTTLTSDEYARLHTAIGQILHEGLELRGTQADLYGRQGGAKHRRNVFERTGQPCPRCGTRIQHVRLSNRNTHYCPRCQQ